MPRQKHPEPKVTPAYAALIALVVASRPDMDLDQVTAEITSCPWNRKLVMETVLALWDEDDPRLNIASNVALVPSHRVLVTDAQRAAYAAHARKLLARNRAENQP